MKYRIGALLALGLIALACGLCLLWAEIRSAQAFSPARVRAAGQGADGDFAQRAAWLTALGAVAVALTAAIEVVGALAAGVGRRTAAGTVATAGASQTSGARA